MKEEWEDLEVPEIKEEASSGNANPIPFVFPSEATTTLQLAEFPSTFKTQDLTCLFDDIADNQLMLKWIDDTTALAIFSTAAIGWKE